MNALMVSPDIQSGGVAHVVRSLRQYLRSKGHNVHVLHSGASIMPRVKASELGFPAWNLRLQMPLGERHPALTLPLFVFLFPIGLLQSVWLIWKQRFQVVNIHYPSNDLFYFAICRRLLSFNLVCSIHGADLFPDGKARRKYHWGMRMLLRYADRIVTPSADLRRKVLDVFPEYEDKVLFIHNGIRLDGISAVPSPGGKASGRYVLSVSAYKPQKGLDVLIRAMKKVVRHDPELKLLLIGEGSLRSELETLAAELGLSANIEFHGRKTESEVLELLRGCETFVLPSRFETFGIAILEAMACGRPVVVSNTGGMPEIVRNGRNGFIVEPEDASALANVLISLSDDPVLRRRIGEAAFEDVRRRFHVDAMGESYERVFGIADSDDCAGRPHADCVVPGVRPS
jgi:glycosyltransferase involved in cell wall biosynthesis